MKYSLLILLITSITYISSAQAPSAQWGKNYGGSKEDDAKSILQTTDGGLITAGIVYSNDRDVTGFHGGNCDIWVLKTDDTGGISWAKCYGGSGDDYGYSLKQTPDGGYIIAGTTSSTDGDVHGSHGSNDMWVIKIDSIGAIQWQKCLGGSGVEGGTSIETTKDGGYIVAGYTSSNDGQVSGIHNISAGNPSIDAWVVKLDDTGGIVWQKTLGGSNRDLANAVCQAKDGGYIIAGITNSDNGDVSNLYGAEDAWAIKLGNNGAVSWQKTVGGSKSEAFNAVQQTDDGSYIFTGATNSNDGNVHGLHIDTGNNRSSDIWVVQLDSSGAFNWQHCYGGMGNEQGVDIKLAANGNYMVCGFTSSDDGDVSGNHPYISRVTTFPPDFWILSINQNGDILWQKCYGGSGFDIGASLTLTKDGGFAVCGSTTSSTGDFSNHYGPSMDFGIIKVGKPLAVYNVVHSSPGISVFPNPSHNSFTLQYHLSVDANVVITDVAGRVVNELSISKNTRQATINAAAWPPGSYFYKVLQNGHVLESGKLVKE